ncbi:MAG: DUF262 domain-containing protein [Synergistaceae bacterium]|nr:DUF262 domain-containing protein [Synergistaceae bacterium]MBP9626954.1 DUF262 domain-containing protein [Synergistaceae bacterium]MBP9958295.1 DUF262 domain-containing protein [Synergistaceae bacterium]
MALLFRRNTKTVKEIYDDFRNGRLIVDSSYQRRKVWVEQDKVRLIETILMDLIIPEVFFWPAILDPETGETVTHIVDGQQRITSIVDFLSGGTEEFRLTSKHLLDSTVRENCSDRSFVELETEHKNKIWSYDISIVNIDRSFTIENITGMFYRLNLTDYSLNPQEKRNSTESEFGEMSKALSTMDFWKNHKVFSSLDARRMGDVAYCCSIYILAAEGIIDQTNGKKINDYYDDFASSFDEDVVLTKKIENAMDIIDKLCDKTTFSFISKKAQMYTLFSFVFKLIDDNKEYKEDMFGKFKAFVFAYNLFRNEYDIDFPNDELRSINEGIKKYKLASSEGINKLGNRMIRFQTLYSFCVESPSSIKEQFSELAGLYQNQRQKGDALQYDALDREDMIDINEAEQG